MAVRMPDRAWAGAQHARALDRPRHDRRIAHARVASQPVLHEEDANQVGRDRRASELVERFLLDLQALFQRKIAAIADGFECNQGSWVLSLGLAFDGALGDGECKGRLIGTQTEWPGQTLAPVLPRTARLQVFDQPAAFVEQTIGRNGVEREADVHGLLGVQGLAGADDLDGRVQADQTGQPLGSAPARQDADRDLGQADLGVARG
jgi:hypothetical protein